ncbi:2-oxoglutarate dehydrogenase E1 component [Oceanobacillus sp. CAU 1775]
MIQNGENGQQFWQQVYGPNRGYIEEQYELYRENSELVDASFREMFDTYGEPTWLYKSDGQSQAPSQMTEKDMKKLTSALKYVEAIRRYGHTEADIYPVGGYKGEETTYLDVNTYGLTEQDLRDIPAEWLWEKAPADVRNGLEVIERLKKYYTGTITFEYDHVNNHEEREWLFNIIEEGKARIEPTDEERKNLLKRLVEVEGFEHFLNKTFVGQKRFSIEGLEMMVPMLDEVINGAAQDSIENIMLGMAHRGRLAVLAKVLGKPEDKIFSEFNYTSEKGLMPSEGSQAISYGWTDDVKYHYGATKEVQNGSQLKSKVTLAHNPSHLEFVNPVVEGFARAAQDDRSKAGYPTRDDKKAMAVLIHGDAAFIGEGVVAETLNLSNLPGYSTGGSLHIIANNLVGFTTDREDGRSTRYASDLAKGFEIPIIRVNADDPISCISAVKIAYEYRKKFKKDFLIDLVGYRRYGHNEMDEPRTTQPRLYREIDDHPSVSKIFADHLISKEVVPEGEYDRLAEASFKELNEIYQEMSEHDIGNPEAKLMPEFLLNGLDQFDTAVDLDTLKTINKELLERPEGFKGFSKTERVLKRRANALEEGNIVDWGTGEALAYATILRDGIPVRLTGQDSERGTFAHRHIVLNDVETNEKYSPMHGLSEAKASFDIRNSPLSEAGVLGFEYGYSVYSSDTLVIWEAQFGDFANVGQVIFDQFISSARAKWGEKSNMVMLLPHGYEGQGPEHSSARLERFLQSAAENNWIVANVTSSAQLFHILRRQAALKGRDEARPLVMMTPKSSMIRNPRMGSTAEEFAEGNFEPLRIQPNFEPNREKATRLLIGSGKIMVDIEEEMANSEENYDWMHILRVEQLYPFPEKALKEELEQLPNLEEIVWVQEEPQNMGAWDFVDDYLREVLKENQKLRVISRPKRSAPAGGIPSIHKTTQAKIINQAISKN